MTDFINASGPLADRYLYDSEDIGFTYLAVDTDEVYVIVESDIVPDGMLGEWQLRNFFRAAFIEVGAQGEPGPEGPAGEDGNVIQINASGSYNNRYLYDSADVGFKYLAVDTDTIYEMSSERVWEEKIVFRTEFIEQGPQGEIGPQGEVGPKGDKGDTGDAGSGINWKGAWSSAVEYVEFDAVEFMGSSFVANGTSTNSIPSSLVDWYIWVSKGDKGDKGDQGEQGIPGVSAGPPTSSWSAIPNHVRYPSELLVYSSLGQKSNSFHVHSNVSLSADGFMSAGDKSKLDGIASGAQVNVGTNLSLGFVTGTTRQILSSTGSGVTIPEATITSSGITGTAGLMSSIDKTKLAGIDPLANNYVHPSGDGNLHVPATSTNNAGKVLTAGSTAGSISWVDVVSGGDGGDLNLETLRIFNVKDFGAVGNGVVNDRDAIRRAIYAASIVGGGTIIFPPGTYKVDGPISWIASWDRINGVETEPNFYKWDEYPLTALDNLHLVGIGAVTIICDIANTKMQIFYQVSVREGSSWTLNRATCAKNQSFTNIIFDGNIDHIDNTTLTEDALVTLSPVDGLRIEKCTFKNGGAYGLSLQNNSDVVGNEKNKNITIIDTIFENNGRFLPINGLDGFDGLDIKCGKNITLINCTAQNNMNSGFDIRGENVSYINCCAYNNGGSGFDLTANITPGLPSSYNIIGGVSSGNGTGVGVNGNCTIADYSAATRMIAFISGMRILNSVRTWSTTAVPPQWINGDGILFYGDRDADVNKNTFVTFENCEIVGNERYGVWMHSSSVSTYNLRITTIGSAVFNNCIIANNASTGVYIEFGNVTIHGGKIFGNGAYGIWESVYEIKKTVSKTIYSGNLVVENNTYQGEADKNIFLTSVAGSLTNSGSITATVGKEVRDYNYTALDYNIKTIASAATITLPYGVDFFWITGTTAISNINGGYHGRIVTFGFAADCPFVHGGTYGNTKIWLFGAANKTFPAKTYITFIFYSTFGWYEMQNSNISTAEQTAFFDTVTMNGSSVGIGLGAAPSTNYVLDTYYTTIDQSKSLFGGIRTQGEFVTINPYALRMISGYDGTRATILYNSLTDFELKITDTNKKYDQFNALAPFKVSLLTGNVTFGHEVFFNKNTIYANTYGIKIKDSGGNQVDVLKVTTSNNIHIGMDHYKSVYLGHGGGYTGGCPVVIRANNENLRVSFIEIDNIKYLIGLYDNG
jgi:hypothetical protein